MNSPLLQNFKINKDKQTLSLDYEQATPRDINIYIGYLIGRINADEVAGHHFYRWGEQRHGRDFCLVYDGHMGQSIVIPDYYHEHTEAFLLLTHRNIVITNAVNGENNFYYIAAKMTVIDNVIQQDNEYLDCNMTSGYISKAGLFTLSKCLEKDHPEKLNALFNAYMENELVSLTD